MNFEITQHELFKLYVEVGTLFLGETLNIPEPTIFIGEDSKLDKFMIDSIHKYCTASKELHILLEESKDEDIINSFRNSLNEVIAQSRMGKKRKFESVEEEICQQKPQLRKRFPPDSIKTLRDWILKNALNPFPSQEEKMELSEKTGLTIQQVNQWLTNARRRIIKPMINTVNDTNLTLEDFFS